MAMKADFKQPKKIDVLVEFIDPLLGTASANQNIHRDYIASKAPDAQTIEEEVEAVGVEEFIDKQMTVFPRFLAGEKNALKPFLWAYQMKGFFKESAKALRRFDSSDTKGVQAYKQRIDTTMFVRPKRILLELPEGELLTDCQRPLRASTPQGERVCLADSEQAPAGTRMRFSLVFFDSELIPMAYECLEYGAWHGIGQWRNSEHGAFRYQLLDGDKVIGGNWDEF
jgi:hypothetical protein